MEPYKNALMESKDFTERRWPQRAQQCDSHGPEKNNFQRKWINFGSQSQPTLMTADSEPPGDRQTAAGETPRLLLTAR